jgi:hypothetical protein
VARMQRAAERNAKAQPAAAAQPAPQVSPSPTPKFVTVLVYDGTNVISRAERAAKELADTFPGRLTAQHYDQQASGHWKVTYVWEP